MLRCVPDPVIAPPDRVFLLDWIHRHFLLAVTTQTGRFICSQAATGTTCKFHSNSRTARPRWGGGRCRIAQKYLPHTEAGHKIASNTATNKPVIPRLHLHSYQSEIRSF